MDLIIFQYHLSFKGHVSRAPRARRPTQDPREKACPMCLSLAWRTLKNKDTGILLFCFFTLFTLSWDCFSFMCLDLEIEKRKKGVVR